MSELKDRSYEDIIEELTKLIDNMENGDVPLEKLFNNYENGMLLLNECKRRLSGFSKKIEVLNRDNESEEWNEFDTIENNSRQQSDDNGDAPF